MNKAFALYGEERYDEAIVALKKSRFHADVMVQYQKKPYYRFTAPLFNLVEGEKPEWIPVKLMWMILLAV